MSHLGTDQQLTDLRRTRDSFARDGYSRTAATLTAAIEAIERLKSEVERLRPTEKAARRLLELLRSSVPRHIDLSSDSDAHATALRDRLQDLDTALREANHELSRDRQMGPR